ncbi:MAG: hypothetical protein CVU56_11595 [Deltaproteobacteria bacterium HGW-Deltaproteobacteria-14]|jgi:predicted DNA-binding transcriptional regulator YafY|nr:MAG: hypothetical protein CVU56_11595 [Deltaproteobacteria bacterium HGW-Deltaproteobacteria-14]
MAVEDPWTRRLRLLQVLLRRGRISTRQVTQLLEVPSRMALDDLKALERHGVPLHHEGDGRDREWVIEEAWRQLGMDIGLEERLSLLFGRQLVESFLRDTDIGDAFARLDRQLEAMGGEVVPERDLARKFIYVREPEKDYRQHKEIVQQLVEAVVSGHYVSFTYDRARSGETLRFTSVAPYTIAVYKRGLYLISHKRGHNEVHAIERVSELVVHAEIAAFDYPRPSEYDPRPLLASQYGLASDGAKPEIVHLRFDARGRPYAAARRWMAEQEVIFRDDGGCDIIFEASGPELIAPVLSFGDLVEVIRPLSLRRRVREMLSRAVERYAGDDEA